MSLFQEFYHQISRRRLWPWLQFLPPRLSALETTLQASGQRAALALVQNLPEILAQKVELKRAVHLGQPEEIDAGKRAQILALLQQLKPWRKGPFWLYGIHIDTEWRSDWKWQRLAEAIQPLNGRYVLDVGCGNGYHLWRMRGAGAEFAVGIDPMPLFFAQFLALHHFYPDPHVNMLPLGIDDLPAQALFDTVFAMGVLYHRRSPIDFLQQLKAQLVKGGELVLETLVIDGAEPNLLMPEERYAKMRNVWFIPSVPLLELWLRRCGFQAIRVISLERTSLAEQRRTDWMQGESLADFLDPQDLSKTIEGYPAPLRAVVLAQK